MMTVYDNDVIDDINLPNQFYRLSDVGRSKVEALREITQDFTGVQINAKVELYNDQTPSKGIVVSGVDSMVSRKKIWESIKGNPNIHLYVDGRMGSEVIRVFTVNPMDPDDISAYEKTLHTDEEAAPLPCTAKAIIYTVDIMAGLVCNQIKKFVKNESFYLEINFDVRNLIIIKL
jgi:hypothetical protein